MKCYCCGRKNLSSAVRVDMPAKDRRCKPGFKDVCHECYPKVMESKGYKLDKGIWVYQ